MISGENHTINEAFKRIILVFVMSINNFLVVSRASPFSKSGSGRVANQFLNFFSKDELVFLCEKNNGISIDNDQIHYINLQ